MEFKWFSIGFLWIVLRFSKVFYFTVFLGFSKAFYGSSMFFKSFL